MMPKSEMTAPSPGALRMRRSRERRRQGDVMVRLQVSPSATADLVALGWLPAPDRVDKDALALALVGFIKRALTMRLTPSTMESESVCFTPLHVTAGPIAIGSDENAPQSPRLAPLGERDGPHGLGGGRVQPGEVLGAAEIVEDKPPEVQPFDGVDTPDIAAEQAEISRLEPSEAQPWAEATQPLEVDPAQLWDQRLALWLRWRMWMSDWGPRPDQDGCLVPD